jgi:hypothetical protein
MKISNMPIHTGNAHQFLWIPLHVRNAGFPPRKPETRIPIFWLTRKDNELFFVNDSDELLDSVKIESNEFLTYDNFIIGLSNNKAFYYQDVGSHEAIKMIEYDDFFDLDIFFQFTFFIQSKTYNADITMLPKKGIINERVMLWNTDELGKHFHMKNKNENL